MNSFLLAKIIGITLLSIGLLITAWKKNALLSIALIVIGIGFVLLMNSLE